MYSSSQARSPPIDGTTLVDHRVFVLGGDQKVFDGSATFEVSLDAISTTDLFDTFDTSCILIFVFSDQIVFRE